MFGMSQVIKIVSILIIVLVVASGLWYVSSLKADLAISQANEEKLTDAIKTQQDLIESIRRDVAQIQQVNEELNKKDAAYKEQIQELTNKFNVNAKGEARDFGAIAAAKPKLIERLINRGTANAMRCLEIASGAPLTEKEINAKTSSEINRECPQIANPNYIATTP